MRQLKAIISRLPLTELFTLMCVVSLGLSCTQKQSQSIIKVHRDTTITQANAFTNLFLDSALVADYIEQAQLEDSLSLLIQYFYNSVSHQMASFTEDGAAQQTQALYTRHQQYINESQDSSKLFPQQHQIEIAQLLLRDALITEASSP